MPCYTSQIIPISSSFLWKTEYRKGENGFERNLQRAISVLYEKNIKEYSSFIKYFIKYLNEYFLNRYFQKIFNPLTEDVPKIGYNESFLDDY